MDTTNKKDKVIIGTGNEIIELTGAELEAFEADRKQMREEQALLEAEYEAKKIQKAAILERIGLTEEELQIVLGA